MNPDSITALITQLFGADSLMPVDALIIMGSPHHIDEIAQAANVIIQTTKPSVVIPSGYQGEAEALADACIKHGAPAERFVLEQYARHTEENVRYSLALIDNLPEIRHIGCVCKNYASLRCRLTFERYRSGHKHYVFTVNLFEEALKDFQRNPFFKQKLIGELKKVLDYSARGWIASIPSGEPYTQADIEQLYRALLTSGKSTSKATH
ncbi:hypothetical protein GCM10009425_19760 [Pseudomonas asuensis]|uniref:DUF218 domain-containing protein n=1 Tax=Pseudomonas asuensis TaxID=1825787 RepID=A0ABQ2GS03_9PSED|nr:YdcF family protein [Pseudomonas asuensis]GGM08547.1 hypothetical protein GCM10009425_19760 [Pseudomonas asuensis]